MKMQDLFDQCEDVSQILKAMAHPTRLRILCYLVDGRRNVNEIMEACQASQSLASQFLGKMKSEGLVDSERDGHFVYYEISDPKVRELIKSLKRIFCNED